MPFAKKSKTAARLCPTYVVAGREGAMSINQGHCAVLNPSNMESLTHGILQNSSHYETVRIGGRVRGNIITEMQVSCFETSITSWPT